MNVYTGQADREKFIYSRKGLYEENAVADGSAADTLYTGAGKGVISEETAKTKEYPAVDIEKVIVRKKKDSHAALILSVLAAAGFAAGYYLSGVYLPTLSADTITEYLNLRINGGFFSNALSSFLAMLLWTAIPFISGFCALGQPAAIFSPALKCLGSGMVLRYFTDTYGAKGAVAFGVLVLPSAVFGTIICVYQIKCALAFANRLLCCVAGKRADTFMKSVCADNIKRAAVCAAGCFAAGIADALISVLFGGLFVI